MRKNSPWITAFFAALLPAGAALAHPGTPPAAVVSPDAAPASRVRVVGLMLASGQVLLWDDEAGRYVLRQVGDTVEGARIVAIEGQALVVDRDGQREVMEMAAAPQIKVPERRVRRAPVAVLIAVPSEAQAAVPAVAAVAAVPDPAASVPPAPATPAVPVAVAPAAPAPIAVPVAVAPAAAAPIAAPVAVAPAAPAPIAVPVAVAPAAPAPIAAPAAVTPVTPVAPAPIAAPVAVAPAAPGPIAAPAAVAAVPPVEPGATVADEVSEPPAAPAPGAVPPPPAPVPTPEPPAAPALGVPPLPLDTPPFLPPPSPSATVVSPESRRIVMPRADFDRHFSNLDELDEEAAIVASPQGYQLAAIRPGGFLETLGLRSGDVVLAVDGRRIRTPDDAARAYAWLRITNQFSVDVLRGGERVHLRYQLNG